MAYIPPAITEIYLCDPVGTRIECLDYITEYEYALTVNTPGPFRLKLPDKFDRKKIKLDNIVEIWRGFGPGTLKLDYCGLLRDWEFADDAGNEYTELYGKSSMDFLNRRIVRDYAGSAQSEMTTYADDMIKAIAKDQLGSDTTADRDLTSVGGGFTIQANLSDAQSITKDFAYKNVLEICQEIADASYQAGTELYFDIVPQVSSSVTGALAFQLQTFTDQRGDDRTWDSSHPIFVGKEWGNLQNGLAGEYHSDEKNWCFALGPGERTARVTFFVSDAARAGASIWNRCEDTKDARDIYTIAGITGEANTDLHENRPKFVFGGDIVETPSFRYGRDWGFGDRVTAIYAGIQKDAMINKVQISRDSSGQESITAKLLVEE